MKIGLNYSACVSVWAWWPRVGFHRNISRESGKLNIHLNETVIKLAAFWFGVCMCAVTVQIYTKFWKTQDMT